MGGRLMLVKPVQLLRKWDPMSATETSEVQSTEVSEEHPLRKNGGTDVIPAKGARLMLARLEQPRMKWNPNSDTFDSGERSNWVS